MEWIGWASLAIIVIAFMYLAVSGLLVFISMKPKMDKLQATAERMQEQQMNLQNEIDALIAFQQHMKQDVDEKKEIIQFVVSEAKETPTNMKQLGNVLGQAITSSLPKRKRSESI